MKLRLRLHNERSAVHRVLAMLTRQAVEYDAMQMKRNEHDCMLIIESQDPRMARAMAPLRGLHDVLEASEVA